MTDSPQDDLVPEAVELPPPRRGWAKVAWLVVGALVVLEFILQREPPQEPTDEDPSAMLVLQAEGKMIVGLHEWSRHQGAGDTPNPIATLNTGPVGQRLRYVVLVGEIVGPDKAHDELRELDDRLRRDGIEPTKDQARLRAILGRLYEDYVQNDRKASSVSTEERQFLGERLDWFGRLALAPPEAADQEQREAVLAPARRLAVVYIFALIVGGIMVLIGLFAVILVIVLLLTRTLKNGIVPGINHGGIYAETFALYMLLFLGISFGMSFLPLVIPRVLASGLSALASLVCLAWPVVRGVPWRQVRQDIGWTWGRHPWLEPFLGAGCYVSAAPLLVGALILTMLLFWFGEHLPGAVPPVDDFSRSGPQAHPIMRYLAAPTWSMILQLVFVASFVAPVVEETMFRGVLYRHLREATHRFGFFASGLVSATIVSFVFAVIHPYGLLGVPILMALAYAFSLYREWRGTLLPSMIAHGVHNGLVLTFTLIMFSQ
jgi:membrane protease YdiL (CAAX protease family)